MNYCKMITIVSIWSLCITCLFSLLTRGAVARYDNQEKQKILLERLLTELGKEYDLFFTIEGAWRDGEPINVMELREVQRPSKHNRVQDELEYLRQIVPTLTYEIDKTNPRIFHIIDARLARQKGYGLVHKINRIDFTGGAEDFLGNIIKEGIPISPITIMSTRDASSYYPRAKVTVKAEDLSVRDALSKFIPLAGRSNRLLWVARTKLGQGELSYITIYGPNR